MLVRGTKKEEAKSSRGRVSPPRDRRKLDPARRALYLMLDVPRRDWFEPSGAIIAFAHSLIVPAGKFVGQPLRLCPFQLDFIRDVYNPRDPQTGLRKRRQAILSVGRRAGKTLMAALIILVHLIGPAKRLNSTIVSAATTRKQASIVFRMVRDMVRMNPTLKKRLKVIDSTKHIVHKSDQSTYAAIAAEAGGQYGEGLDLVVYDELAQAKSPALYDALMTSLGAQVEPLMMIISTQAPANDHILSELIDYGLKIRAGEFEDDTFTVHLFAANDNARLMDEAEWRRANPTLGDYRDLDEFRATMQRATKVPSLEASVRNLYLNMRVQAKAPYLTSAIWALGSGQPDEVLALFRAARLCRAGPFHAHRSVGLCAGGRG
ncbi:MAG: terminase large subunit [Mesorhizobium sp.]